MNRTTAFLGIAAALLVAAVLIGLPKSAVVATPAGPAPIPALAPPPPEPEPAPVAHPGSLRMTGSLSHPLVGPGTSDLYATLEVQGVDVPNSKRAKVNLALVIDRSGSMSGTKIAQARKAALRLVELLEESDRLAIVHYGSDVRAFPGALATPENKERMRRYIRNISEEGGTNIGAGLRAGQAQLASTRDDFTVNRLLLLSDGQPTVGVTSTSGLLSIASNLRATGITLTALGVGSDFNEDLMRRFSDVGGGAYGYIRDAEHTAALFEKELQQAATVVARNVSVSFQVPAGVRFRQVFGRPASEFPFGRRPEHAGLGNQVTVTLPDFSARQVERLVVHFSVDATGADLKPLEVADFRLEYSDLLSERASHANVRLTALVTGDRSLAQRTRNKDAYVLATRARAAANLERAAGAIQNGAFDEARKTLQINDSILKESAQYEPELTGDFAANQQQIETVRRAPQMPAQTQSEYVKQLKAESLRGSGRSASSVVVE